MLHAFRQSVPSRIFAAICVASMLLGIGLEARAAWTGHVHGEAQAALAAPASGEAHGDDCAGGMYGDEQALAGCCHPAACHADTVSLSSGRTAVQHAIVHGLPAVDAGLAPGIVYEPPLRPPR